MFVLSSVSIFAHIQFHSELSHWFSFTLSHSPSPSASHIDQHTFYHYIPVAMETALLNGSFFCHLAARQQTARTSQLWNAHVWGWLSCSQFNRFSVPVKKDAGHKWWFLTLVMTWTGGGSIDNTEQKCCLCDLTHRFVMVHFVVWGLGLRQAI